MSEPTHADLVAAVEGARPAVGVVLSNPRFHNASNAHLDTLAKLLVMCADSQEYPPDSDMGRGYALAFRMVEGVVADALRRMGAL